MKREKQKKNDQQLSLEVVIKSLWDPSEKLRETGGKDLFKR